MLGSFAAQAPATQHLALPGTSTGLTPARSQGTCWRLPDTASTHTPHTATLRWDALDVLLRVPSCLAHHAFVPLYRWPCAEMRMVVHAGARHRAENSKDNSKADAIQLHGQGEPCAGKLRAARWSLWQGVQSAAVHVWPDASRSLGPDVMASACAAGAAGRGGPEEEGEADGAAARAEHEEGGRRPTAQRQQPAPHHAGEPQQPEQSWHPPRRSGSSTLTSKSAAVRVMPPHRQDHLI